jgi:hypothetical protein
MSLYSLGIGLSPLSPLRRQFTAPIASTSQPANADADDELSDAMEHSGEGDEEPDLSDEEAELTQDSKDVLMDRLNDLLHRLAVSGSLKGDNISSLHAKVDEMEKVLASDHSRPARPWSARQRPSLMQLASPLPALRFTDEADDRLNYWGLPATPTRPLSQRFAERSGPATAMKDSVGEKSWETGPQGSTTADEHRDDVETPSHIAEEVLLAAQRLCAELNRVLQDLQDRKEESDARPLPPFPIPFPHRASN